MPGVPPAPGVVSARARPGRRPGSGEDPGQPQAHQHRRHHPGQLHEQRHHQRVTHSRAGDQCQEETAERGHAQSHRRLLRRGHHAAAHARALARALPPEDRNCMWLAYPNDEWREAMVRRDDVLRAITAKFRAAMAEHVAEPPWKALVARLRLASPEFREIWERHEVLGAADKEKRFRNSRVGPLHLEHTSLWPGPRTGPRLVTYVPVDEESRERLERLQALALAEV
ncbi:hypothetical protein GUY61_21935 [Streptomyces sp. GC420]|nr:hypothetical protein [Streptomyces sp. GC420]